MKTGTKMVILNGTLDAALRGAVQVELVDPQFPFPSGEYAGLVDIPENLPENYGYSVNAFDGVTTAYVVIEDDNGEEVLRLPCRQMTEEEWGELSSAL